MSPARAARAYRKRRRRKRYGCALARGQGGIDAARHLLACAAVLLPARGDGRQVAAGLHPAASARSRAPASSMRCAQRRASRAFSATSGRTPRTRRRTTPSARACSPSFDGIGLAADRSRPDRVQRFPQGASRRLRARPQRHRRDRAARPARRYCSAPITTACRSAPAPVTRRRGRDPARGRLDLQGQPAASGRSSCCSTRARSWASSARAHSSPTRSAANVDSLLNFEARGVTGPVDDVRDEPAERRRRSRPIRQRGRVGRTQQPGADVARLIPNDTDVTTYKERGWLTLNFAMTGNETRYHSPGDDLAALDPRSLQDMGDQALRRRSAARRPARRQRGGNRMFVDIAGGLWSRCRGCLAMVLLGLLLSFGLASRGSAARWCAGSAMRRRRSVAGGAAWLAIAIMGALRAGQFWRAHPNSTFIAIYATVMLGVACGSAHARSGIGVQKLRAAFGCCFC